MQKIKPSDFKRLFIIFLLLSLFSSCGKKLPPPSFDRIKPDIKRAYYFSDGKIKIEASEEISKIDSIKINYQDSSIVENFQLIKNVILVQYDPSLKVKSIDIFSITDLNNNAKDIMKIKILGEPFKDEIKPQIIKTSSTDSIITFFFSEKIKDIHFRIFPDFLKYSYILNKDKLTITFKNLNESFVQMVIDSFSDLSDNMNIERNEKKFFTEKLFFNLNLKIENRMQKETFYLYDIEDHIIMEEVSDDKGNLVFRNLKRGRYKIKGKDFFLDTLLLE